MRRKIIIEIIIVIVVIMAIAVILAMWLDFNTKQSSMLEWMAQDPKLRAGLSWLLDNTREGETVLAWWDYGAGIEKLGNRNAVIKAASKSIKGTIAGLRAQPWGWIEYELWYPFEPEDRVKDVANFFIAENPTESINIAKKYGANYVLVVYPDDVMKFYAIVLASGHELADYITGNLTLEGIESKAVVKKYTVGIRLIYGEEVIGFEKVFDNGRVRIYKVE